MRIIPLQEKKGNYDVLAILIFPYPIIPLQEKKGNYDGHGDKACRHLHYTTTREKGELRLADGIQADLDQLYHYKRKRGTTTITTYGDGVDSIIPLQEKKGNYDRE